MEENNDSEIIEHHDDEEMEKMNRPRNDSQSFMESVSASERDGHSSTQSSHRLLAYSDALISIIATVMVLIKHTHTSVLKVSYTYCLWSRTVTPSISVFADITCCP